MQIGPDTFHTADALEYYLCRTNGWLLNIDELSFNAVLKCLELNPIISFSLSGCYTDIYKHKQKKLRKIVFQCLQTNRG